MAGGSESSRLDLAAGWPPRGLPQRSRADSGIRVAGVPGGKTEHDPVADSRLRQRPLETAAGHGTAIQPGRWNRRYRTSGFVGGMPKASGRTSPGSPGSSFYSFLSEGCSEGASASAGSAEVRAEQVRPTILGFLGNANRVRAELPGWCAVLVRRPARARYRSAPRRDIRRLRRCCRLSYVAALAVLDGTQDDKKAKISCVSLFGQRYLIDIIR